MNWEGRIRRRTENIRASAEEQIYRTREFADQARKYFDRKSHKRKDRKEDHATPEPDSSQALNDLLRTLSIINRHIKPADDFGSEAEILADNPSYSPRMRTLLRFGRVHHKEGLEQALDDVKLHHGVKVKLIVPNHLRHHAQQLSIGTGSAPDDREDALLLGFVGVIEVDKNFFVAGIALRRRRNNKGVFPIAVSIASDGTTTHLPSKLVVPGAIEKPQTEALSTSLNEIIEGEPKPPELNR